jgi:hypothetical protein
MLPRGVLQLQPRDILGPGLERKANFRYGFDLTCWSVPVLVRARLGRSCSISQDCKPSAVHRRPLLRSTLFFGRRCGPARMADQAARQRRRLEITSPIGMSAIQVLRLEAASPFTAPVQTVAERIFDFRVCGRLLLLGAGNERLSQFGHLGPHTEIASRSLNASRSFSSKSASI